MAGISSRGGQDGIAQTGARVVGFDIEVVVGGDVGAGGFEVEFAGGCEGASSEGGGSQGELCEEHFVVVE